MVHANCFSSTVLSSSTCDSYVRGATSHFGRHILLGDFGGHVILGDFGRHIVLGDFGRHIILGYFGAHHILGDFGRHIIFMFVYLRDQIVILNHQIFTLVKMGY